MRLLDYLSFTHPDWPVNKTGDVKNEKNAIYIDFWRNSKQTEGY